MLEFFAIVLVLDVHAHVCAAPFKNKSLIGKLLDCVAQSNAVHWYTTHISAKMMKSLPDSLQFGNEPAPEKYQELGRQAQTSLKIPVQYQLPIKKMSITYPGIKVYTAIAGSDAIYINVARLNQYAFGRQRSSMFHESVHVKYNDDSMIDLIALGTLILAILTTHIIFRIVGPRMLKIFHVAGIMAAGFIAAGGTVMYYRRHMERRADIEGHYALQCAQCVHESAERVRHIIEEKNPIIYNGYLMPNELEALAHYFEQQNKSCAYHSSQRQRL